MADMSKGTADGEDTSGNRKRKHTSILDLVDDDVEIQEENESSDDDVHVEGDSEVEESGDDEIKSVLVETTRGNTIYLKVKGSDTIGNLKVKIQAKENIPFDQQELMFNNMVLDDINTLASLHLKKDSTFTVLHKSRGFMTINIKNIEGGRIRSVEVKPSYTIRDVKAKISCLGYVLVYNENVLEDSGTLADFHIFNDSTLTLIRKYTSSMEIFVNTFTGKTISLSVKPTCTIAFLKSEIEFESKIMFKEHIPSDKQALIFNKMVLADTGTLLDFHIYEKSTLTLMCKSTGFMKIFIKTFMGETITLEVKPSDTIHFVKSKIQDKIHVPHDVQLLSFNEMLLDNMSTLADFHINNESTLTLMQLSKGSVRIFIKTPTEETITLDVNQSDTIDNIKAKIQDKVHIPHDDQVLIFNETVLDNIDTLSDFHINNESTLTLMRLSRGFMPVFIKPFGSGKNFTLNVKPSDTIKNVKSLIQDKEGLPPCYYHLIFDSKKLEEGATLADYRIPKGSIVNLFLRSWAY